MTRAEKFSHYGVAVIALCAVLVSVWQMQAAQKHNRLSVRPFLETFTGWVGEGTWQISLSNHGIGPAIITKVEYEFGGKTYRQWDTVLDAAKLRADRRGSHNFNGKSYLAPGTEIEFLTLERSQITNPLGIKIRMLYESVYEEPFVLQISV